MLESPLAIDKDALLYHFIAIAGRVAIDQPSNARYRSLLAEGRSKRNHTASRWCGSIGQNPRRCEQHWAEGRSSETIGRNLILEAHWQLVEPLDPDNRE